MNFKLLCQKHGENYTQDPEFDSFHYSGDSRFAQYLSKSSDSKVLNHQTLWRPQDWIAAGLEAQKIEDCGRMVDALLRMRRDPALWLTTTTTAAQQ